EKPAEDKREKQAVPARVKTPTVGAEQRPTFAQPEVDAETINAVMERANQAAAMQSAAQPETASLAPATAITCNGAGGNWSSTGTWSGGVVPTAADSVTITNGCTVTIDTAATALSVNVQSGGILQYEAVTARTLTVGQSVTIDSGGTFQSAATGTITTHVLSVGTDLV